MLKDADYVPASGPEVPFKVGFERPDEIVMDGVVHTTDYTIEYRSADVELKRGYNVRIDNVMYRVRQPPQAQGDGAFMRAFLEKV